MNKLTTPDLHLGLTDLLTRRTGALRKLSMGAVYEDALRALLAKLAALPEARQEEGRKLATELKETDVRHDGLGTSITFVLDAHARSPLVSEEVKAAAERVRAAFIPSRSELQASYAEEANRAHRRANRLTEREDDLARFPMADGGTLRDHVAAFLAAGDTLYDLLQQRARLNQDDDAAPAPLNAGIVRSETLGLLGRIRSALADDVTWAGLAPEVEADLFGFLDLLNAMHNDSTARRGGAQEDGGEVPPTA